MNKDLLKSLLVMADIIEARDTYTGGHVWRVSQFAKLLANESGLSKDEVARVGMGGFLHDLGKVGIPDAILRKKDKLDDTEYETIKTHPMIGVSLLQEHPLGEVVLDVTQNHHERMDGKGYPNQLDGDSISMNARILSVADTFDALTSSRPYRRGMKLDAAMDIMIKGSGSQFDPQLIAALQTLAAKPDLLHIIGHSDEGIPVMDCPACGAVFSVRRHTHDGDIAFCRTCTGKMVMHKKADALEAEFTGTIGTPQDLQPKPDVDMILDFVKQTPASLFVKKSFFAQIFSRD